MGTSGRRLVGIGMAVAWLTIAFGVRAQAQVTQFASVPVRDGKVWLIDTVTGATTSPTVGTYARCLAPTKDGRFVYAPAGNGGSIAKIDVATSTVVSTLPLGGILQCLVLSPDEQTAYVTDTVASSVRVIDLAHNQDTGIAIPVPDASTGLAITPDGTKVFNPNFPANSVSVIDTVTNTIVATPTVGLGPIAVLVLRDGAKAYVANLSAGTLSRIDVASNAVDSTVAMGGYFQPWVLDESWDDASLLVGDANGQFGIVMLADESVSTKPMTSSMMGIAQTPYWRRLWTLDYVNQCAFRFDPATMFDDLEVNFNAAPESLARWIGPNLIVPDGSGPLTIHGDSDLTSHDFGTQYVDFNGGALQLLSDWTSSRTLSFLLDGGTIDTNGHTATLSGATVGEGTLTKTGAGRLIWSGTTGHVGQTTISGGVLQVDGTHMANIYVVGGTLSGSGRVGNVLVDGTYGFGHLGPGSLSATGTLTAGIVGFDHGASFDVRLNGPAPGTEYDQLRATTAANLGNVTLNVQLGYTPAPGSTFTILTNVSSGTFNGLPEGAELSVGGQFFRITYHGGSGLDVVLMLDSPPTVSTISDVTRAGSTPQLPVPVTFTAFDDFSNPPVITVTSSNQALVPNANLSVSGVCAIKTLTITPAAHVSGQSTITITVSDGTQSVQRQFLFTITDAPPTLQSIPNQSIHANSSAGPIALTLSDDVTLPAAMVLGATSSNQALLADGNIQISSGAVRTLTATPATHTTGQTTITVAATDFGGHTVRQSFRLDVTDGPPTITGLADQTIAGGTVLAPMNFTVGDDLTAADSLVVSATSSNTALLPNVDIVLGGSGATRTISAMPVFGASGTTTITVSVTDGANNTSMASFALNVSSTPVYFLAEGATGSFFSTDILLANPNAVPAPITITFYKDDGSTVTQSQTLPATSRVTISVKDIAGLESASFATAVASTGNLPIMVERTMTWDASGYGSHGEKASSGAATTWYFAEGSQGYFHTYYLLLNPHQAANVAHVTYYLEDGSTVQRDYTLASTSRRTLDISTEPALINRSFGAVITFDLPGMAERAMYFGDSPVFSGGHDAAGVTAPATSWFLAEGATGSYFDTFILLANPNDTAANVTTTYLPASGVAVPKTHVVQPHQRLTLNIADEDPSLASVAVATSVTSDQPVIAERSQYWPHGNWYEAHNSAGETSSALKWGLAEGRVGGAKHAQTYILLANPGAIAANVTATFLRQDGTTVVKTFIVGATSRLNIAVTGSGSDVPELADEAFGTVIESTQPIIVERSMYTDANGVTWAAGTNATAARLP